MKWILTLMLLLVLGCSKSTPKQEVERWQQMYMKAARDVNTAKTPEAYYEAVNRKERYEYNLNQAHDAMIKGDATSPEPLLY